MRKIKLVKIALVVILALAASSLADAGMGDKPDLAAKGIRMTRHNLSNWGLYDVKAGNTGDPKETQVCIFCHTPHNTDSRDVPLWGHKDTAESGFIMASSFYVKLGKSGVDSQPTGISKKCLSCHDGTVAIGALAEGNITMTGSGLNPNETLKSDGSAPGYIGTDLRRGHVISFNYDDLFQATYSSATKLRSRASMDAADQKSMFDRQGKMHCHSCHDPHTDWCDDPNKTVGPDPLWRKQCGNVNGKANSNATVCVVCHRIAFTGSTQVWPW